MIQYILVFIEKDNTKSPENHTWWWVTVSQISKQCNYTVLRTARNSALSSPLTMLDKQRLLWAYMITVHLTPPFIRGIKKNHIKITNFQFMGEKHNCSVLKGKKLSFLRIKKEKFGKNIFTPTNAAPNINQYLWCCDVQNNLMSVKGAVHSWLYASGP